MLLKNTLAITVPAIGVFVVLIFMFMRYPVFDQLRDTQIGNVADLEGRLEELYNQGNKNVRYTAHNLNYTGFDYYVDDKLKGAYYYSMNSTGMQIFLVKTKNPKFTIDSIDLRGKIVKDTISTEYILSQYESFNNLDPKLFDGYCSRYIISEPDYPRAFAAIMYGIYLVPILCCIIIFLYTVLVWAHPALHGQARQLAAYGDPSEIIADLDQQIAYHLKFWEGNIIVTEDYLIVSYLTKLDVVRLDLIKYMSKNLVEEKRGMFHHRAFRLTMSNPDKLFYEIDFSSERLINRVVRTIRGMYDDSYKDEA